MAPVSTFRICTAAAATTAPAGSATVPVMVPRSLWAIADTAHAIKQTMFEILMKATPLFEQTSGIDCIPPGISSQGGRWQLWAKDSGASVVDALTVAALLQNWKRATSWPWRGAANTVPLLIYPKPAVV